MKVGAHENPHLLLCTPMSALAVRGTGREMLGHAAECDNPDGLTTLVERATRCHQHLAERALSTRHRSACGDKDGLESAALPGAWSQPWSPRLTAQATARNAATLRAP